jgi:hypothetical protein
MMAEITVCERCGHKQGFHRHNDDLADMDCHGPDGNYQCEHFRCLHPWLPFDFAPCPDCHCENFV